MNPELLEQILSCNRLPTIPAIAMRVVDLTRDKNVSMRALAELITNDQGLAAKILRTVNSSFYGLRQRCSSINQAIVMLGLSAVKSLALGFCVVQAVKDCELDDFDHVAYWRRSLYCGVAARCIAKEARIGFEEECFLGGLLQDVGMIALYQTLGKEYTQVVAKADGEHRKLAKYELEAFEVQHPDVGALLADRWKLPEELSLPVKYHERPTAAPTSHCRIIRAVGLGNIAADFLSGRDPTNDLRRFYERAESWFGINPALADEILKKITAGTKEIASLLEIHTGKHEDSQLLLQEARKQLSEMVVPECIDIRRQEGEPSLQDVPPEDIDELTGLPKRRRFEQTMIVALEQARAADTPLSMAIFEIDEIDEIADRYGQDAADSVIINVAARVRDAFAGTHSLVCCYEDGRIAVAMPRMDKLGALKQVEKARLLVHSHPVELVAGRDAPPTLQVTTSVGLTAAVPEMLSRFSDITGIEQVTEQAVRAAQRAGRNLTRVYAPLSKVA
jgi:two-component system cell cycle response regulator